RRGTHEADETQRAVDERAVQHLITGRPDDGQTGLAIRIGLHRFAREVIHAARDDGHAVALIDQVTGALQMTCTAGFVGGCERLVDDQDVQGPALAAVNRPWTSRNATWRPSISTDHRSPSTATRGRPPPSTLTNVAGSACVVSTASDGTGAFSP